MDTINQHHIFFDKLTYTHKYQNPVYQHKFYLANEDFLWFPFANTIFNVNDIFDERILFTKNLIFFPTNWLLLFVMVVLM